MLAITRAEAWLLQLRDLAEQHAYIKQRYDQLLPIAELIAQSDQGAVVDAIVDHTGVYNTIADVCCDSAKLVWTGGWGLGFEGFGGELVILISYIQEVRRTPVGVRISLDSGETVHLRVQGRMAERREQGETDH